MDHTSGPYQRTIPAASQCHHCYLVMVELIEVKFDNFMGNTWHEHHNFIGELIILCTIL